MLRNRMTSQWLVVFLSGKMLANIDEYKFGGTRIHTFEQNFSEVLNTSFFFVSVKIPVSTH